MPGHLIPAEIIEKRIFILREQKIMIDFHLAELYGVETRALKQQVRRNKERFPVDFMFELNNKEIELMLSQNVIPSKAILAVQNHLHLQNRVLQCFQAF